MTAEDVFKAICRIPLGKSMPTVSQCFCYLLWMYEQDQGLKALPIKPLGQTSWLEPSSRLSSESVIESRTAYAFVLRSTQEREARTDF